ncbi:MAG: PIN domain-containing protein [Cyanobacteria bacterium J06643_4]
MAIPEGQASSMKLLIDTNVIIDMAIQREPFAKASTQVIFLAQNKQFHSYVSAAAISDLYYVSRKMTGRAAAVSFLKKLVTICDIAPVGRTSIESALASNFKDVEDAIQNQVAVANGIGTVVTRNIKDFTQSELQIVTPDQLLKMLT